MSTGKRDGVHKVWIKDGGATDLVLSRTDVLYRSIDGHGIAKLKVRLLLHCRPPSSCRIVSCYILNCGMGHPEGTAADTPVCVHQLKQAQCYYRWQDGAHKFADSVILVSAHNSVLYLRACGWQHPCHVCIQPLCRMMSTYTIPTMEQVQ